MRAERKHRYPGIDELHRLTLERSAREEVCGRETGARKFRYLCWKSAGAIVSRNVGCYELLRRDSEAVRN